MTDSTEGRTVVNAHTTPFLPYDLEGPVQPEMSWLPLSYDSETGEGTYLMRMEPGGRDDRARPSGHGGVPDPRGRPRRLGRHGVRPRRLRQLRGRHAPQLVERDGLPDRRLRVAQALVRRQKRFPIRRERAASGPPDLTCSAPGSDCRQSPAGSPLPSSAEIAYRLERRSIRSERGTGAGLPPLAPLLCPGRSLDWGGTALAPHLHLAAHSRDRRIARAL